MKIDKELVLGVARLAHLELNEAEAELFTKQLADILHYIEKLNEVNEAAEPFSFNTFLPSVTREDVPVPCLPVEEALQNAPEKVKRFFKVPRILP